jgi:hypothetical protein
MDGLLLVPYQKTRYHLSEWDQQGRSPENAKELFNLRHSSLRMVVERAFGVLKWRFSILRLPRKGFSIRTQVYIVYACVALHNWLNSFGRDIEEDAIEAESIGLLGEGGDEGTLIDDLSDDEFRDELAKFMWECYIVNGKRVL